LGQSGQDFGKWLGSPDIVFVDPRKVGAPVADFLSPWPDEIGRFAGDIKRAEIHLSDSDLDDFLFHPRWRWPGPACHFHIDIEGAWVVLLLI